VTLGDELALVERYLGIEQVRFGERLRVERAVDPEATACRVPPLLLQPLVENAIKHGIQDMVEGGAIRIEARCEGGLLRVVVENPVDADAPVRRGEGVGLENVRRRLEVFGSREAHLSSGRKGDRFRVTLTLPALEAEAARA
jgi:LytS/YehU family sensor histidine kinase